MTVTLRAEPQPVTFEWKELVSCIVDAEVSALAFWDGRWLPVTAESAWDLAKLLALPCIEA